MSKRNLPAVSIGARANERTHLSTEALNRWNPAVRSAAEDAEGETTISVLDVIGETWFGEGVSSKRVAAALRAIGDRDVTVIINSPGGDYFEGLAIYNMLREHPAEVTVKILGMAASAASVIAMAGDRVEIARAGFLMIHNCWVMAAGDRHALTDVAEWLLPFDEAAIDIYNARTGIDAAELGKMLDRETWIGGRTAVDKGFADSLLASDEVGTAQNTLRDAPEMVAKHKLDTLLAKSGIPRSERRALLAALNGGMPGAAPTGMPGAAVETQVSDLLATLKSI